MGVLRYIKMTYKDDMKKSRFYMLVLVLSVIVIFNIFNIAFSKDIFDSRSTEYLSVSGLGVIVIGVSMMFILFANSYYMEEKFTEYAVMAIGGNPISTICEVIMIRNTIAAVISVFLGCILGILVSFPVMKCVCSILNITTNVKAISDNSLLITVILMITEMEIVYLINTSKVYGSSINELFHRNKNTYLPDKRKHRIHPIVYVLLYIFPVLCGILPMSCADKVLMIRYTAITGLIGIWGVVRYVVPEEMKKRRQKQLMDDKYKLIQLSNVYSSIQNSGLVIIVLVTAILLSIMIASRYEIGSLVSIMSLVCYGMIIFIMSLTVIYKFAIEAQARKNNFKQFKLMGYTKSEIKKIIIKEVKTYYLMLIALALPFVLMITLSSVLEGLMTITTEVVILIAYIAVFSSTGIVSYKLYSKNVL